MHFNFELQPEVLPEEVRKESKPVQVCLESPRNDDEEQVNTFLASKLNILSYCHCCYTKPQMKLRKMII